MLKVKETENLSELQSRGSIKDMNNLCGRLIMLTMCPHSPYRQLLIPLSVFSSRLYLTYATTKTCMSQKSRVANLVG